MDGKAGSRGALAVLCMLATTGHASEGVEAAVEDLQRRVAEQQRVIEHLDRELRRQDEDMQYLRQELGTSRFRGRGMMARGNGGRDVFGVPYAASDMAEWRGTGMTVAQAGEPVGQAPERAEDHRPPEVAPIFEQPGVLTPRGQWIIEPSLQYTYSTSNRIALVGYTIIPALLIGLIDVREVKSNSITAALTVRRGITNRFELEAKIPFVYRSDTTVGRAILKETAVDSVFDADGKGLGDIEITGRYQLNDGGVDKPYYIAWLRFKTRTGKDPFEVETDLTLPGGRGTGLQTEMPTGSGFYTITPGLTVLIPSDPVVFFGGISYQHSIKRSNVSRKTVPEGEASRFIGTVQPGPSIGFNFGMGLALNDRSSFSIGYDHLSVGKVKVNGSTAPTSVRVQLGTLLLGYSYRMNSGRTLNLSVGAGLTRDTPDLQLTLRVPISL